MTPPATPYSQQANLGAEYLIAHDLTASVNYLFVRGVKLPRTVNVNLLPPTVLTLQNAASLGVPNPTAQQIGPKFSVRGAAIQPSTTSICWKIHPVRPITASRLR